uniref:Uncharacterized protein n=1 Tax=Anser cygnoides TaxID=8845 RepID=A0A8B9EEA5_ANSCY
AQRKGFCWCPNFAFPLCIPYAEKQRELARKGSLKNGNMGSPVNQQPKKNNVMARTRLVIPNKGYSSLDQSPDEKPLVALDTDSDDDFDMSRYSSSGYSSAEINQDLNIQLLKDGYRLICLCNQNYTMTRAREWQQSRASFLMASLARINMTQFIHLQREQDGGISL